MVQSFNLQAAMAATFTSLVGPSSTGWCARAVRMILEAGGINTSGRPNLARQYVAYLPTIGFSHIGILKGEQAQANFTSSGAKQGDIAVYQKPGKPDAAGHICIWNGQNWCSDFRQRRMNVYSAPVEAFIYRWTGTVSNAPVDLSSFNMAAGGTPLIDMSGLDGEELAKQCPEEIEFKGMWSRYQLMMGQRSNSLSSMGGFMFAGCPFGPEGTLGNTPADALARGIYVAQQLSSIGGFSREQAAAIAGVLIDENWCNPQSYMKAEKAGKGASGTGNFGYGAGIGSWTHAGYKNQLLALVGLPPFTPIENLSMDVQIKMLIQDSLVGPLKKYYNALRQCPDFDTAAATACIITLGVGYGSWSPYCTPADAKKAPDIYGRSNDARFGPSPNHWNLDVRRKQYGLQVLQGM